jgi:hypothetical protein
MDEERLLGQPGLNAVLENGMFDVLVGYRLKRTTLCSSQ